MQMQVTLDDKLLNLAFECSPLKSAEDDTSQLLTIALEEFIKNHKSTKSKLKLSDLRGKVEFADDYDYKAMREGL